MQNNKNDNGLSKLLQPFFSWFSSSDEQKRMAVAKSRNAALKRYSSAIDELNETLAAALQTNVEIINSNNAILTRLFKSKLSQNANAINNGAENYPAIDLSELELELSPNASCDEINAEANRIDELTASIADAMSSFLQERSVESQHLAIGASKLMQNKI